MALRVVLHKSRHVLESLCLKRQRSISGTNQNRTHIENEPYLDAACPLLPTRMPFTPDAPDAGARELCDDNPDEKLESSLVFWSIAAVAAVAVASNFFSTGSKEDDISYTKQAEEKCKEYQILPKHVRYAIKHGRKKTMENKDKNVMLRYKFEHAGLNVFAREDRTWLVLNAYWDRKNNDWSDERKHFEYFSGM